MPTSNARIISARDFATPEKTTFDASPPAANTRSNSPCETISKPDPNFAMTFKIPILELALTA